MGNRGQSVDNRGMGGNLFTTEDHHNCPLMEGIQLEEHDLLFCTPAQKTKESPTV